MKFITVAQRNAARLVLKNEESTPADKKEAQKLLEAFDKQKTEEHRATQAKRLSSDVKAGIKELGEKLGLSINLSHISVTPRGIVNIGLKGAPEGVTLRKRS